MSTTNERIEFTAPTQPPPGSVVLDSQGVAWQRARIGGAWLTVGASLFAGVKSWA